jgi:hypothetical protein
MHHAAPQQQRQIAYQNANYRQPQVKQQACHLLPVSKSHVQTTQQQMTQEQKSVFRNASGRMKISTL